MRPIRPSYPRGERVFKREEHWYFHTKDAGEKGPYIDKQNAYWALAKYIRRQCSFQ
ncbi:MAG: DUF6316 family protein [Pseudomonadales bacterium]